jgi:hypothetical protein
VIDPGASVVFDEGRMRHLRCPVDGDSDTARAGASAAPTGANGSECRLCGKPLGHSGETWLVDRAGDYHHVECWCRMVTIKTAEVRERGDATRRWVAEVREEATRRLKWATRHHKGTPPPDPQP